MSEAILKNIERAIKDIHNIGIMLTGASEYVCEEGVLKRFSRYLQAYHKRLESDITSLKKEYPGKFPETPELDNSLSRITDISAALEQDKKAVETKCRAGSFGHELNTQVAELKSGVRDIWETVTGKVSGYSITDRLSGGGETVTSALYNISPFGPIPRKIIIAVLAIAAVVFGYLFFTMESEDALVQGIKNDRAHLETERQALTVKQREYEDIQAQIKVLDKIDLNRKDKIKLLSLTVEEGKLRESIEKITVAVEKWERELKDKNMKLEELRKKPFLQKLLKR
jgi:hypothetical protein